MSHLDIHKYTTIARVLGRMGRLREHDSASPEDLQQNQAKSLRELRGFTYQNSPFYRNFHSGLEEAPLQQLPVLNKQILMDNFDELFTDRNVHLEDVRAQVASGSIGRFRNRYEVVATSGSTGNPGIFLFNPTEWATLIASFGRSREWAGLKVNLFRRSKMAVVSSVNEKNLSARVGKAADNPFIPTLRLDAIDPIVDIDKELNDWQPESLVAYASMAYYLTQEQVSGALKIHPKYVFTSSEVLTPPT